METCISAAAEVSVWAKTIAESEKFWMETWAHLAAKCQCILLNIRTCDTGPVAEPDHAYAHSENCRGVSGLRDSIARLSLGNRP